MQTTTRRPGPTALASNHTRQFSVDLECDGTPYRYTATRVADQAEACQRARHAFSQQPGVTYSRMRVLACVESTPVMDPALLDHHGGDLA